MNTLTFPSNVLATSCGMLFLVIAPFSGCGTTPARDPRVNAVYDTQTGVLKTLIYDANINGKPEAWSHMDGTRVIRVEQDRDEDGVVERWEYYDADRNLTKVGLASRRDGRVDTWVFPGPDGKAARVERATENDGVVDRIDVYEQGRLVRVEEDGDRDGRIDRWQTYTNGRLAAVALDTTRRGVPDRRFVYGPDGSLLRIERPQLHTMITPRNTPAVTP